MFADRSVSFVMTVYNKEAILPEVLAALIAQTGDFEHEYVIVNDGSKDNSLEVIMDITSSWSNIRVIDQPNAGPATSRYVRLWTNTGSKSGESRHRRSNVCCWR